MWWNTRLGFFITLYTNVRMSSNQMHWWVKPVEEEEGWRVWKFFGVTRLESANFPCDTRKRTLATVFLFMQILAINRIQPWIRYFRLVALQQTREKAKAAGEHQNRSRLSTQEGRTSVHQIFWRNLQGLPCVDCPCIQTQRFIHNTCPQKCVPTAMLNRRREDSKSCWKCLENVFYGGAAVSVSSLARSELPLFMYVPRGGFVLLGMRVEKGGVEGGGNAVSDLISMPRSRHPNLCPLSLSLAPARLHFVARLARI